MGKSKQVIGKSHLRGKVFTQQVARVLLSFSLIKLIDTRLQSLLSQENFALCMRICKFRELLGPNYQAIFQSWMNAESTKSSQRKGACRLEHNKQY